MHTRYHGGAGACAAPGALLEAMRAAQGAKGFISRDDIRRAAALSGVPEAEAYGAASFYGMLSLGGPAPEQAEACMCAPCLLAGAAQAASAAGARSAACQGLCEQAPVVLVGGSACQPGREQGTMAGKGAAL